MEVKTFYCSCGQDFEVKRILQIHKLRCPVLKDVQYGKSFDSITKLRDHRYHVHRGYLYKCEKCLRSFKTQSHLTNHSKVKHLGVKHKCENYDQEFKSQGSLYNHKKKKH